MWCNIWYNDTEGDEMFLETVLKQLPGFQDWSYFKMAAMVLASLWLTLGPQIWSELDCFSKLRLFKTLSVAESVIIVDNLLTTPHF